MIGAPPVPPFTKVDMPQQIADVPEDKPIQKIKDDFRKAIEEQHGEIDDALLSRLLDHHDKLDAHFQESLRNFPSGTEALVCEEIAKRQAHGLAKYGVTVEDNPLKLEDWVRHAFEEALDMAVYLRRILQKIESDKLDKQSPSSI